MSVSLIPPSSSSSSSYSSLIPTRPIFHSNSFSQSFSFKSNSISPISLTSSIPNSKPISTLPLFSKSSSSSLSSPLSLKSRLLNGDTLYGLFLCSFSPSLAEISGLSGYDFVVVDMEHGFGDIPRALTCLQVLASTHTPSILRLPETTAALAKKALDLGPHGIMFPMIDSPEAASKAVSYCRYPPRGVRGAAHPIVRASQYGIDAGYLTRCEDELLIMCQVESVDAVDKVGDIAAVEGVDCIQMGPTDLSATMGHLWDPGNKKVMEMMYKIEKAVLESRNGEKKGAYLAGFAMPHDSPLQMKSRGYHMISGSVDLALFRTAALNDVNNFKMSLESDKDEDPTMEGRGEDADSDDDVKYWSE